MGIRCGAIVLGIILACTACAADVDRDDAIASLEAAGASPVTATCIADTLAIRERLDVAAPGRSLNSSDRELLRAASDRCRAGVVNGEAGIEAEVLGATEIAPIAESLVPTSNDTSFSVRDDSDLQRSVAISIAVSELMEYGRSAEFATCAVNEIVDAVGIELLRRPGFGMGRSPIEATAYALCS